MSDGWRITYKSYSFKSSPLATTAQRTRDEAIIHALEIEIATSPKTLFTLLTRHRMPSIIVPVRLPDNFALHHCGAICSCGSRSGTVILGFDFLPGLMSGRPVPPGGEKREYLPSQTQSS
jgi:hypothetical protein